MDTIVKFPRALIERRLSVVAGKEMGAKAPVIVHRLDGGVQTATVVPFGAVRRMKDLQSVHAWQSRVITPETPAMALERRMLSLAASVDHEDAGRIWINKADQVALNLPSMLTAPVSDFEPDNEYASVRYPSSSTFILPREPEPVTSEASLVGRWPWITMLVLLALAISLTPVA